MDFLNQFWRECESHRHLAPFKGWVRRARPYTLDADAVTVITELSSGSSIRDKLSIYRLLARLPFDDVWMAFDYLDRFKARQSLGTTAATETPDSAPDTMGWLFKRVSDTVWRATTVVRYEDHNTPSGRAVDTFGLQHVVSTEGPLTNFRSLVKDPVLNEVVMEMNREMLVPAMMWGFATDMTGNGIGYPEHLQGTNAFDMDPSWEIILLQRYGNKPLSERKAAYRRHIMHSARELMGDLRFIVAALATINEVPMTYRDVRTEGKMRVGGAIREYMVNRIVTIGIPKKRGLTTKVLKMLRLAEIRMRRHEVSGYFKRVRYGDGRVERRWINNYMRGDASLGYVRQEREVVGA